MFSIIVLQCDWLLWSKRPAHGRQLTNEVHLVYVQLISEVHLVFPIRFIIIDN